MASSLLLLLAALLTLLPSFLAFDHSLPSPVLSLTLHRASQVPKRLPKHSRELQNAPNGMEMTPLYPGYGTHFAFFYIGTPPTRQTAIIDTGSAYTAFPCTGCNNCGKHFNNYLDPKKSSTASLAKCGKNKKSCMINQKYSEGSSWEAIRVQDTLYVGGNDPSVVPAAKDYAVNFEFGCMTSVTGLFQTQLADGIMGLSRNQRTLPRVLKKKNVTSTSVFALCFETGNGVLSLGGVDQTMHERRSEIKFARLNRNTEDWAVQISGLQLGDDNELRDFKVLNKKGAIFDSGSTDTVFPTAAKNIFLKYIPELRHLDKENRFVATRDLHRDLPSVVLKLVGVGGNAAQPKEVQLTISPDNYLTKVNDASNIYELSIFFDDSGPLVLGANAMSGYNIIFDEDNNRIGFVKAKCSFENYVFEPDPVLTMPPTAAPKTGEATNEQKRCENSAYSSCSAQCTKESPSQSYEVNGTQHYDCTSDETKPCFEYCSRSNQVQRGVSATCLNSFWTECSAKCSQSRLVASFDKKGKCSQQTETRSCYIDQCPSKDGDILIFADAMFYYKSDTDENRPWSKLYEEDIIQALSILFKIMPGNIDVLVDPESSLTDSWAGTKLQFQIYLKLKDFLGSETKLYNKAETIRKMLDSVDIGSWMIAELSRICDALDKDRISRYSYLFSFDFEVKRSVMLPIGEKHDPTEKNIIPTSNESKNLQFLIYFLIGGIVAIAILAGVIIFVHYRLRADYELLAKDKILSGGRMAKTIWNRLKKKRSKDKKREREQDIAEAKGLMSTSIHDDDDDLNEFM